MPILGITASQITGRLATADFVLIQTLTASGSATTLDFTSIPSTYKHLRVIGNVRNTSGTGHPSMLAQVNGDTGTNYSYGYISNGSVGQNNAQTTLLLPSVSNANGGAFDIFFTDYTSTSKYKNAISDGGDDTYTDNEISWWRNTAAINRLTFSNGSGNLASSSVISIYGLKG